ncbi:hypothetical protein SARC_00816 [Sphaeroforma arctica JP610]|uniref:N-acetyltransferase domain-containing protein n=1 Tax=Sphaeroforma arctica JP610 TaxID=667725 RepID=A0A0L0GDK1_9EUKA|nr:hypothetical protein SARC_00816 [Sphaeroforma arctica JP610]KNC87072.1 hypothetical protein SARC_00816 [Sphaeroforma arctica JP610]|eukprot:XP_014160974.1 hypothetical protein SARC_00816 [Sphaeroforma arctica JP610]
MQLIKYLNKAVFTVAYNDAFYEDIQKVGEFAKLAYYADVLVGTVCCKFETDKNDPTKRTCYIMTLGCLDRYRRVGVGSLLLHHILKQCVKDDTITQVRLHVQSNNDLAMSFYQKFDFINTGAVASYYKDLTPSDAYLLVKNIEHDLPVTEGVSKIAI